MKRTTCSLCTEAAAVSYAPLYRAPSGAGDLVVLPSVGALAPGHVLICPVDHSRSWAERPPDQLVPALDLFAAIARGLGTLFGAPVHLFEHGNARTGTRIACSVEHAHIHALPANVSPSSVLDHAGPWEALSWSADVLKASTAGSEYLLYRTPDGRGYVSRRGLPPTPSQLMRKLFANALGRPEAWNWRTHPAPDLVEETRSRADALAETIHPPALSA